MSMLHPVSRSCDWSVTTHGRNVQPLLQACGTAVCLRFSPVSCTSLSHQQNASCDQPVVFVFRPLHLQALQKLLLIWIRCSRSCAHFRTIAHQHLRAPSSLPPSRCPSRGAIQTTTMVGDEELRKIKSLATQYRINQKFQGDEWPSSHKPAFECVQQLGQTSFQHYSANIDRESDSEPWRRQNKARAEWLVEQASRLSQNTANESTWRMRIENAILERFSFEVAWYVPAQRPLESIDRHD